ncbi:MAG: IS21-like element helper ATPase IstB [Chlamydiia bacterium]|nr:IS21-like element helper ATPase IstB [Chlamydiia bacterium]
MRETTVLPTLLKELRLPTISRLWEDESKKAIEEGWSPSRYLTLLCEYELSDRNNRKLKRRMAEARFPKGKSLETFDFAALPSVNKSQIKAFASGEVWLENGRNLLIFGPSGVGKTHLSGGIGEKLVEGGYRVLFTKTTELVQELQATKKELMLSSAISKLNKYDCLILDDFGYVKKDEAETSVLFELICERYESKSLIITCNQGFAEWDKIFTDKAMAIAAADRLVHHATILDINGESYRKKTALSQVQQKEEEKGGQN